MNVSFIPELESYLKQKVTTGMNNAVSEVVREAMKLEELRQDIQKGLASLDAGHGVALDVDIIKTKVLEQQIRLTKK